MTRYLPLLTCTAVLACCSVAASASGAPTDSSNQAQNPILLWRAQAAPAPRHSTSRDINNFLSGTGAIIYGVAAVGLPLIEDGRAGRSNTLRTAEAFGVSELFSEGLKRLVKEKRPDTSAHDSFPSGHATGAFSLAAVEAALHPRQAPLWYGGATLISASRVFLHRHTVGDVVAGALLGYGTARWELAQPHGLILTPWINPAGHSAGLALAARF